MMLFETKTIRQESMPVHSKIMFLFLINSTVVSCEIIILLDKGIQYYLSYKLTNAHLRCYKLN
jgi:hypothetical protein